MKGLFTKRRGLAKQSSSAGACSNCGCLLSDPSWRNCPRCQQEIESCSGCGGCGGCGK